jgi:hypothetical protein
LSSTLASVRDGFRAIGRSWGLVPFLLAVNVAFALVLAAPLVQVLEKDLESTDSASHMMYGFDYPWWSQWSDAQSGWTSSFAPDVFGRGFVFKNLDLLLKGYLPAGIFAARPPARTERTPPSEPEVDRVILGLGVLYLLVQTFLTGGLLGVLRAPQGHWTVRGLLHGSGFYFGRLLRVALLALIADWVLFRLNIPFARWADRHAREAVSERTAMAWLMGRHLLLFLGIVFVNMVSSYAKLIVVVEERASAVLAMLSSLAFCLGNLLRTLAQYALILPVGLAVIAIWSFLDGHWETTGYKTQIVTLLMAEALVAARIALRLVLLASQVALYRRLNAL